jgi:hypothetical protein
MIEKTTGRFLFSPRRSRRSRRGERGAALTETIVVVPVFIVIFAGMIFFHQTVAKTQQAMAIARRDAWNRALQGCREGPRVPQPDLSWGSTSDAPGAFSAFLAGLGRTSGEANDTAKVTILAANAAPAAQVVFSADVSSKMIVTCNTVPERGDFPGVIDWYINRGVSMWSQIF